MIDLALHRARATESSRDLRAKSALGAALLSQLATLCDHVEVLLPSLRPLRRIASRPHAALLYAGWSSGAGAQRLVVAIDEHALIVRWGYGRGGDGSASRARAIAEEQRRRRSLGDALVDALGVLRGVGAVLTLRDDTIPVSEDEWCRSAGGSVSFHWHLATLDEGELLARRVAEAVGRLAALASSLGPFPDPAPDAAPTDHQQVAQAVRALRWEERAQGHASPPSGMLPSGRTYSYDPVSGWFAPALFASMSPASLARIRAKQAPTGSPPPLPGVAASIERGLHDRLARWLAVRGTRDTSVAASSEVIVAAERAPGADELPMLEVLVRHCLGDASGDIAVALAGLLEGVEDVGDPVAVAGRVPLRLAPGAARGVARLREHGVMLHREDAIVATRDPALSPVIALAVDRALGGLERFAQGSAVRRLRMQARAWELGGIARGATLEAVAQRFARYTAAQGTIVPVDLCRALIVGLRTKPFAILAGRSGTGKTRVALQLARFFTAGAAGDAPRVAVVPVRPDWIDSRGLLGWLNVVRGAWEDTEALRVMLHAIEEPAEPHFVILDEMNLARAEHYLAEVLSAIESGEAVPLHGRAAPVPTADGARVIPSRLRLPANLFVLGTVNLDESTYALSPRVVDRAWTWEFVSLPPSALARAWLGERRGGSPADSEERASLADPMGADDPVRAMVLAMGRDGVGARVDALYEALAAHGRPFGFRVISELLRFVQLCEREGIDTPPSWWLDRAVLGKVLPALAGPGRDLAPVLRALREVVEGAPTKIVRDHTISEPDSPRSVEVLRASAEKLRELLERAETDAWVSFARA